MTTLMRTIDRDRELDDQLDTARAAAYNALRKRPQPQPWAEGYAVTEATRFVPYLIPRNRTRRTKWAHLIARIVIGWTPAREEWGGNRGAVVVIRAKCGHTSVSGFTSPDTRGLAVCPNCEAR